MKEETMEKKLLKDEFLNEEMKNLELTDNEKIYLELLEQELAHGNCGNAVNCSCNS